MTLQSSSAADAEQAMARAGKTFYQAARLLPKDVRGDVVALYAFCRRIDDLADEPSQSFAERQTQLQAVAYALETGDGASLRAAGWPFAPTGRLPQTAALLVGAALGDLEQRQPATDQDVLGYAFGVAGTVGILMAEVLRARPEGYGAAVALGVAMQLSNICRDVAEDLHNDRVYLPADRVIASEIEIAFSGSPAEAQRTQAATLHLLALAQDLYEAAYDGMWSLPWRIRWSILAAAMCYREIGMCVAQDVPRSWKQRTVVSRGRKLYLIAAASVRLLHPRFWWPRSHKAWCSKLGTEALVRARGLGVAP